MMRPPALVSVCVVACLSALAGGCRQTRAEAEAAPTPVRVATVETFTARSSSLYSASIVPYSQVDLAFKSGGYVESVHVVRGADGRLRNVQEGDWVRRGTVLARVRTSDYQARVEGARAQMAQAEAGLQQARLDFERTDALYRLESATEPQYEAARAKLDAASAGVKAAESVLSQARSALDDCALRAPFDGLVLRRSVEVGSLVGPSAPGFSLAETRLVKAVFGVPDLVVQSLKLGDQQAITTPALPERFIGRITAIAPAADAKTRTFSIEVTLSNNSNALRSGMVATLTLAGTDLATPVPVVPLAAVVRAGDDPNGFGVFTVEQRGDRFFARARRVELGEAHGSMIGFRGGLAPGDRVIVSGVTEVRDGDRVRIVT